MIRFIEYYTCSKTGRKFYKTNNTADSSVYELIDGKYTRLEG